MAVRRPFILHIAAHRSMGATGLANSRGEVDRVLDDDLVRLLAPDVNDHPAVLVLSFCDSADVARRLLDLDIAVISFEGELPDDAAPEFFEHLYQAFNLGRTVRMAFEVGHAAVRANRGIEARLNGFSSAHDRQLPAG